MRTGNLGSLAAAENTPALPADPLQRLQVQMGMLARKIQEREGTVQPGALIQYYADLSSGALPPEDLRIEDIRFNVRINPDGSIASNTQPLQVISRYNFAFRRVMGYAMNPALVGAGPALVSFNVKEAGRNFPIFKTDINLQSVLANGGAGNIVEWDGVYITVPGTQLEVTWAIDSRWPALVGTTQEFGVQLVGDLIACRPNGLR
jgi:hypothetical protein